MGWADPSPTLSRKRPTADLVSRKVLTPLLGQILLVVLSQFAVFDDQVVVVATRTVAELSPGEISRLITVVATIADDHDDALQSEFAAAS